MPIPVITIAQMREWEKATWATGQTEAEVIRRVGKCIAGHALRLTRPDDLIVILAGTGNNGEDARCAQGDLAQRRVDLIDFKDPAADLSKLESELSLRPVLIIDGLFGIGINRSLDADWIRLIERVNTSGVEVLAVDVPSGLNGETGEPHGAAIRASVTLTVGAPKVGMLHESAWPFVGRLEVATEVGLIACPSKSDVNWTLAEDFRGFPPARAVATHKGTYGHAGIVAGSVGYHGASVLAARGAQRARPGLITLHIQEGAYHSVASQLQAVMVSPWKPQTDFSNYTAILIGPGLAAADLPIDVKNLACDLWLRSEVPVIVDASALAWLPSGAVPQNAVRLITPHPGEAARMLGTTSKEVQSDRVKSLRELSRRCGNTWVVLKGHETLIGRSQGEVFVNSSGNPYLAQGGSGDLLSGYLVGLLAQPALQEDPLKTIRYAVWQHGAAADRLQNKKSNWFIEDLAKDLGRCR
jgi:ADP-dependent NAD(P)H-hydrate dehydratase / NAD(P)H-hydrate epimerase